MSNHSTQFEATEGGISVTHAILLYQAQAHGSVSKAEVFASIHPVAHNDGRPVIEAGAPLSKAHLRQWTEALGRATKPELLPANILVSHPDMLAWWTPAQVRPAYFDLTNPPAGLARLGVRTVVPLPYPAHLFIATRGALRVYALPYSVRPEAHTPVLFSPVLNVYVDGKLCWGNIPKPKALTIASIEQYERAVFDSWSTHPNPGQETTVRGKGGLVRLWDDLAARNARRFPIKRMKPFTPDKRRTGAPAEPMTVGKLIAQVAGA